MSKAILIIGESGNGKTTAMRTLDPKTTYYIDADKKGLTWKGWKKQYSKENGNYLRCSNAEKILKCMYHISEKMPNVKTIVIDTLNWIMLDDEFDRMKEKGYDKWLDLAISIRAICSAAKQLRDDLTVICIAHSQTDRDDSGYMFTRMKTSGKKLDKISVESMFSTVLICRCKDAENGEYVFETQANNSTAKSPMGAFEEIEVPNDIQIVMKALEDY